MDGARIQVHKGGADVRIYTRALNDVTGALPEIVAVVRTFSCLRWYSMVRRSHSMHRADRVRSRSRCVASAAGSRSKSCAASCRSRLFSSTACDSMRTASRTVRHASASRRLARRCPLRADSAAHHLLRADGARLLRSRARSGHEGLMAKSLDAPYEAGNRGASWLRSSVRTLSIWWCWLPSGATAAAPASFQICISVPWSRPRANTSCSARPSKASRMRCSNGRRRSFWRARLTVTSGPCTCGRAGCEIAFSDLQRAAAIRAAWRCGSHG